MKKDVQQALDNIASLIADVEDLDNVEDLVTLGTELGMSKEGIEERYPALFPEEEIEEEEEEEPEEDDEDEKEEVEEKTKEE